MYELTRLVHENPSGRRPAAAAFLQMLALQPGRGARDYTAADFRGTDLVPVPLSAELWSRAVFHRKVSKEELVGAIIADHTASLICHGLAGLDDQTLEYIAEHSSILSRLVERGAPAFCRLWQHPADRRQEHRAAGRAGIDADVGGGARREGNPAGSLHQQAL
jgi:hypothetical protein